MTGKDPVVADTDKVMETNDFDDGGDSDQVLWRRAQRGEAAAFGLLYRRHARAVYNYCFRRTADAALAEDLAAAVFVEVWASRGREPLTCDSALPWLLAVAGNLLRNQWRSARRRRAALDRLPPLEPEPDIAVGVAARLDAERAMRALRAAVQRLPQGEQEALELCAWAGLNYQDAAEIMGISPGSVGSRLSRARARLGAMLRQDGSAGGHDHSERATALRPRQGGAR